MATRSSARVKADRALSNVRRDRKMMTVTAVIALASAGGLVGYFDRSQPEPPPAIVMTAVDDAKPLTLTFAGDTMLGDGAQEVIATHGLDHPLAAVRRLLTGDVVVVNAEAH